MKSSDPLLPKLPSLAELMKHPTVEQVVRRVNQTTVAQRAAGFLEELRANLRKRDIVPSVQHLAERLARRLLGGTPGDYFVINATGVVLGDQWEAPLAQATLEEMVRAASEYRQADTGLFDRAVDALRALTGADTAWIGHSFESAVRLCHEQVQAPIEIARFAGIVNPAEWRLGAVPTIAERLAQGAEVVVVDAGGMIGGPRAAIVAGRQAAVEAIATSSRASSLRAQDLTLAALAATLELHRTPKAALHGVPVLQLLSAPLENLQQRAERLGQLIAALDGVAAAEPRAVESVWLDDAGTQLAAASWVIAVKLSSLSASAAIQRLSDATPRLQARVVDEEIHLDLRSVFPRWDQQLVVCVESLALSQ